MFFHETCTGEGLGLPLFFSEEIKHVTDPS
nr:MAG TPA: hypothetical protein [Caudoviricetes sp.]